MITLPLLSHIPQHASPWSHDLATFSVPRPPKPNCDYARKTSYTPMSKGVGEQVVSNARRRGAGTR